MVPYLLRTRKYIFSDVIFLSSFSLPTDHTDIPPSVSSLSPTFVIFFPPSPWFFLFPPHPVPWENIAPS